MKSSSGVLINNTINSNHLIKYIQTLSSQEQKELIEFIYIITQSPGGLSLAKNLLLNKSIQEVTKSDDSISHQETISMIGLMSSELIHEVKNYIQIIEGYMKLLGYNLKNMTEMDQDVLKYLDVMQDYFHSVMLLINDYNDLSKRRELNLVEVNTLSFVEDIKNLFENRFPECSFIYDVKPFKFNCDLVKIRQIIINLIKNSCDSLISNHIEDAQIIIKIKKTMRYVYFYITDNGLGIPAEKVKNLFTPFYTTKSTGTGLGLSFSKKMAHYHKGDLKLLYSRPKETCFVLKIPLH